MNNRPRQLEILRKKHYDQLYGRNPQLMERLKPFLRKAEIIEDPLSCTEPKDKLNGYDKKKELMKGINKFNQKLKKEKDKIKSEKKKKISELDPRIIWSLK